MKILSLVIVDVQQAMVDEGPADGPAFLGRLTTLLSAARSLGVPVAHVRHSGPPGDELEPGKPGWEITPSVGPVGDEPVFDKHFNSSFKDTGLGAWLKARGITDLVIAGMQTEFCIDATIKSAFDQGYRIFVPQGGHTTFDNGTLTAAQLNDHYSRQIWNKRFASVEPVEALVERFRQD